MASTSSTSVSSLVVSALLLTVLFFKLGLEQRLRQVGLFKALGISEPLIRRIFAVEGLVLAVAGSLLGLAGAAAYGWLMMWGLRTRWISAVGTTRLTLHVEPGTLLLGAAAGVTAAFLCILLTLRRLGKAPPRLLLAGEKEPLATGSGRRSLLAALVLGAAGLIFLLAAILGWIGQTAGFFGSGALLLVSLLAFQWRFLTSGRALPFHGRGIAALGRIGLRNMSYRPGRSLLSIGLIALATFIIVTVGVFRRDGAHSLAPESGTGGFALAAESSIPFFQDPDDPESRRDLNLDRLPSRTSSASGRSGSAPATTQAAATSIVRPTRESWAHRPPSWSWGASTSVPRWPPETGAIRGACWRRTPGTTRFPPSPTPPPWRIRCTPASGRRSCWSGRKGSRSG